MFYFILSILLVLLVFREQNDFLVYYTAGGVFLNDIENLYIQENYLWNYRYFPFSAIFFVPFYFLGFELGFVVFQGFNLILNILICSLLYKIITIVQAKDHEKDDKRIILYLSLYLMSLPQIFNYILGQINLLVTFLIVLSLYIFLKFNAIKWDFFGSIMLGLSMAIKPITIFLIPFLIIISFDFKRRKFAFNHYKNITRIIGAVLPLSLNIILFLLYPILLEGFLATNFSGNNPVDLNFSFSVTKLIINFCYIYSIPFNQILIFTVVLAILGSLSFLFFIFRRFERNSIVYGYLFGILIMLLAYFDSWNHHLLVLTPILIVVMFDLDNHSEVTKKFIKPSFFFFSFFDLAFMGVWFLVKSWFPYNVVSTIFLMLNFYGVSKYCLIEKISVQEDGVNWK